MGKKLLFFSLYSGLFAIVILLLSIPFKVEAATTWATERTLSQNTTVNGDLIVTNSLDLNGYVLTVNGNMIADSNVYLGEYGKLVVNGNYLQKSHYIDMYSNGTTVDVSGDYMIYGLDANGNEVQGSGGFYKELWSNASSKDSSVLNIGGNFIINTTGNIFNRGTINLNGDLIDKSGSVFYSWDRTGLNKGNATINFNGSKQQTIDIVADTYLDMIGGTNDNIKVKKYFNGSLKKNFLLKSDESKVYINGNGVSINGYSLTVPVSVIAKERVSTGEYGKLIVKGDYLQAASVLEITNDGSSVDISGNLYVCGVDSNGNEVTGTSYISTSSQSELNVGKSIILNTTNQTNSSYAMLKGIINLKGDFVDKKGSYIKGTTINFNGTQQQSFDITSNTEVGCLDGTNNNIIIGKYLNGELLKDFTFKSDEKTIYINNYLVLNSNTLTLPTTTIASANVSIGELGVFIVKGDYIQKNGWLSLYDSTRMDVSGNFKVIGLDSREKEVKGSAGLSPSVSTEFNVGQNLVYNSTGLFNSEGTYNVKGDFIDDIGKTWDTVNLVGNVSSSKKQTVSVAKGGKIKTLTLKSCPKFYTVDKSAYDKMVFEHKWDKGVVTKEPTTTADGEKTYTCSVCGEKYTEPIPKLEPIEEDPVKAFVTRFYTIILQRSQINDDEIEYYTSRLKSRELDGCSVAKGFVLSPEYVKKGESDLDFVKKMYAAFFNREADAAQYYCDILASGASREVVLAGFVNSPEFKNLCAEYGINPGELILEPQNNNPSDNPSNNPGNNPSNNPGDVTKLNLDTSNVDPNKLDEYVKNLYIQILGRGYDEGGLQYWKEQIMAGTTYDAATAARVGFFESNEYRDKNKSNRDFVIDCYHAFLGREPEADGLTYWTGKLDSGEYSKQKVIDLGFGHSEEFKGILRGCGFGIIE